MPQYLYIVSDADRAIAVKLDEVTFVELQLKSKDYTGLHGQGGAIVVGQRGMEKVFQYTDRDRLIADYKEVLETLGAIEVESEKTSGEERSRQGILKIEHRVSGGQGVVKK